MSIDHCGVVTIRRISIATGVNGPPANFLRGRDHYQVVPFSRGDFHPHVGAPRDGVAGHNDNETVRAGTTRCSMGFVCRIRDYLFMLLNVV